MNELFAQSSCREVFLGPSDFVSNEVWGNIEVRVSRETLFGNEIEVRRVGRSQLIDGKSLFGEDLGGEDAVFIGLNSLGHMYLVANVYRYDGKMAFEKPTLNTRSSILDRGLVLRIQDTDGTLQDQIIDYFKENGAPRAIDCSAGACKVMNNSTGIQLARTYKQMLMPEELVKKIVVEGVKNSKGEDLQVQLFVIGNGSVEAPIAAAERQRQTLITRVGNIAVQGVISVYGLVSVFTSLFFL